MKCFCCGKESKSLSDFLHRRCKGCYCEHVLCPKCDTDLYYRLNLIQLSDRELGHDIRVKAPTKWYILETCPTKEVVLAATLMPDGWDFHSSND